MSISENIYSKPPVVIWQRAEALLIFITAISVFCHFNSTIPWWASLLLFLAPDISFIGYIGGPKIGAFCYNVAHVYGLGILLFAIGMILHYPWCMLIGALWLAHSGFDRMLGYGLKSSEGFSFTHLGMIGKQPKE